MACRERRRHDGVFISMQSKVARLRAFFPIFRKMSDFPEFFSQQPLKIFRKFFNRIVA
jgi:hypothetical protein